MLLLLASLSFWDKTNGTWINTATILIGTLLGLVLKGSLPLRTIMIGEKAADLVKASLQN